MQLKKQININTYNAGIYLKVIQNAVVNPDFNNEGAYGHVNMSAKDGVITLDLICHTGFRNDEQLEDMEAII